MPAALTHQELLLVAGLGAMLLLGLALSRGAVIGRLVQLAIWGVLIWLIATAVGERGRFDPLFARLAGFVHPDGQVVSGSEVRVRMADDGHFWVRASIDGVRRRMLVDSGATLTALSAATASAAGLAVRDPLMPVLLHTANGTIRARSAQVGILRFGTVTARDLAVVVSPAFGDMDVLGMNFLSRLKSWRVEGDTLILTPHHPQRARADIRTG